MIELHFPRPVRTTCPDEALIPTVENALRRIDEVRGTDDWVPEWAIVEKCLLTAKETGDRADLGAAHAVLVEALRITGWLDGDGG